MAVSRVIEFRPVRICVLLLGLGTWCCGSAAEPPDPTEASTGGAGGEGDSGEAGETDHPPDHGEGGAGPRPMQPGIAEGGAGGEHELPPLGCDMPDVTLLAAVR